MTAVLDSLINLDQELFLQLNNLGNEKWDAFWLWVTDKKSWIPLYFIFLVTALFYLKKWKAILLFIVAIALLILFVDQSTSSFFKPYVGRLRPCYTPELEGLFRLVKSWCGGKFSFISGHSSNSFAVAVFLGSFLRGKQQWIWSFLIFWAGLVAYSRIYVGVHFPLDIICGAIWGSTFGYIFYKLFELARKRWGS